MKQILIILTLLNALYADYKELLFNGNCITCHRTDELNKSAPTIIEIRKRYIEVFPKKEEFVKHLSQWVYRPNEEKSIMQKAIQEYKLMPELGYDIDTLEQIAEFIYEKEFM
ncbi:c-type cytochrome [Halarcobacter ebronensis]|uniref:Cytochrome C n=1 Tax=Halarcobacter ebronensis TaxID=1462615 RepID=A0A4V1M0Q1_9BACT|nr:c-type cytochrome [Halarcobacter ebronensis]QKF82518.1 hypothetical protein AEBR_2039 [Halarcobacter ebronensis]RXK07465.1 cytochrome C [Halarcobacter ebronensis]